MKQFQIIDKSPCKKDLFEGRPHERLAVIIADNIVNNDKCKVIGIEGGWGSGKSNVVGLIESKLQSKDNQRYHFFIYDVWGHQTDLPRRTMLEELISDLVGNDKNVVFEEESWKESLQELLAKKKETKTLTIPSVGVGVIFSGLLLMLTPLFNWLSYTFDCTVGKICCLLLPYIVTYGILMLTMYCKLKKNIQGKSVSWNDIFQAMFAIYKDKVKEDTKYETISEREPSSRQFRNWMKKVDNGLGEKGKVLILVIDNMDRLPKYKVRDLWATIHSVFSETAFENIRIIIPFDRKHIRNAFQDENLRDEKETVKSDGNNEVSQIQSYGDDFINKTFNVVYRVAPPIMSGWKNFFECKWREVFGDNRTLDSAVTQIYDLLTVQQTPRNIIAFINEFATIRNVVDANVADKYIALYIFGKNKIAENPLSEILEPTYLRSLDFMYQHDEEMKKCISAIYFQLPVENAMDVVFTQQVTNDLNNHESQLLEKLKDSSKVYAILEHSIAGVTSIGKAVMTMEEVFGSENNQKIQEAWENLYHKELEYIEGKTSIPYVKYHKVLLSHIEEKKNYFGKLAQLYCENLGEGGFGIKEYIKAIDNFADIDGFDPYDYLLDYSEEIEAEKIVELVKQTKEDYNNYGLYTDEGKLDDVLTKYDEDQLRDFDIYPILCENYELPQYVNAIKGKVKAHASQIQNFTYLIDRLKEVCKKDRPIKIEDYLSDTILDQTANNIKNSNPDFLVELCAMRLSRFDNYHVQRVIYNFDTQLNSTDENFAEKIASRIENYTDYGEILKQLCTYSHKELLKRVALKLTTNSYGVSRLDIHDTLSRYDTILTNSEITSEQLLNRLNDWKKHLSAITLKNINKLPLRLFKDAQNYQNELTLHCLSVANGYMKSLTQEQWNESMKSNNFDFKLYCTYHSEFLQNFYDAFKEILKEYIAGNDKCAIDKTQTLDIVKILLELNTDIRPFFRNLRDELLNRFITRDQLLYLGALLFEYGDIDKKIGSLEHILPTDQLTSEIIREILIPNTNKVKSMIDKSDDPSEFINKMRTYIAGELKDSHDFAKFCQIIGIKVSNTKTKES